MTTETHFTRQIGYVRGRETLGTYIAELDECAKLCVKMYDCTVFTTRRYSNTEMRCRFYKVLEGDSVSISSKGSWTMYKRSLACTETSSCREGYDLLFESIGLFGKPVLQVIQSSDVFGNNETKFTVEDCQKQCTNMARCMFFNVDTEPQNRIKCVLREEPPSISQDSKHKQLLYRKSQCSTLTELPPDNALEY